MAKENRQEKDRRLKQLIRRAHRFLDPYTREKAYIKWRIQCRGKQCEVRTYGLCTWSKVVFRWRNGREFYRLTRNMKIFGEKGDENTPRREYFRGRLVRRYIGFQNCFVEFCTFLWKFSKRPTQHSFSQAAQILKLDKRTTDKYISFYRQCFCS